MQTMLQGNAGDMKTYTAHSDAEALALSRGEQTLIVMPFKEQPPSWCKVYWPPHEGDEIYCVHKTGEYYSWKAPYAPGEIVGVKEAVATGGPWNIPSECHYWYPADGGKQPKGYQLRSAGRCPVQAIRTRLLVESVEARQVQSITDNADLALRATGVGGTAAPCGWRRFAVEWDRRYPAHPWASSPWAWFTTVRKETGK